MDFGLHISNFVSLLCLLVIIPVFLNASNDVLIRRKRYLTFPEGASMTFVLTPMLSTHKDIIWLVDHNDYVAEWWYNSKKISEKFSNNNLNIQIAFCLTSQTYVYPPTIYTQNFAWGIAYNLPNQTSALKPYFGPKFLLRRRHRRDLYGKMEHIMDSMGYNGRSCILKALCEATHRFMPQDSSLTELILKIVFSYPQEPITPSEPEEHRIYHWASQTGKNEDDCWEKFPQCPFSLIDLVMGYYSETIG